MSLSMDFSFKNELISNYFKGDDSYIPSNELIYVHEHPLLTNNFMYELDILIKKTTELIKQVKFNGPVITRLIAHTKNFGAYLPVITAENAPLILSELRSIYKLCNELLKQYGVK